MVLQGSGTAHRSRRALTVFAYQFDVSVRPYTLRTGDTLESIAKKRGEDGQPNQLMELHGRPFPHNTFVHCAGITVQQIVSINHDVDPDKATEGQTILLPSGKLSARDKEILDGIDTAYRIYPVRKGETLDDIITKRNITRDEMQGLNQGVNLDKLKGEAHGPLNNPVLPANVRHSIGLPW